MRLPVLLALFATISALSLRRVHQPRLAIVGPVTRIGTLDGPAALVFGDITDAATSDGIVLILDQRLNRLRAYDRKGRYIRQLSRPGAGPGELSRPTALAITGHQLSVLDPMAQRILKFAVSADTAFYDGYIPMAYPAFDLCELDGTLFALGVHADRIIHSFNKNGTEGGSFGKVWGTELPLLTRSLSRGLLACSSATRTVVAASFLMPDVRAYDAHGNLRWTFLIPHFVSVSINVNADGSVTYRTPKSGYYDQLVSLNSLADGSVVIQYGRIYPDTKTRLPDKGVQTVVLDSEGKLVDRQDDLPRIVAIGNGYMLTSSEDPFPYLEVATYAWKGN